jgi:hypothetical protein
LPQRALALSCSIASLRVVDVISCPLAQLLHLNQKGNGNRNLLKASFHGDFPLAFELLDIHGAWPNAAFVNDGDYCLGPEHILQVWIWKDRSLSTTAAFRPDGRVLISPICKLEAKGATAPQLQDEMQEKLRTYLTDSVVNMIVIRNNALTAKNTNRPDTSRWTESRGVLSGASRHDLCAIYAKQGANNDRATFAESVE